MTTGQAAETMSAADGLGSGTAEEIKGLLQHVADRLADADRRQAEVLDQMQQRLAHLGNEARGLRARVPSEFSAAFERIEDGMSLLASRIAASSEASAHQPFSQAHAAPSYDARGSGTPPMALRSAAGQAVPSAAAHSGVDTFDVVGHEAPSEAEAWDPAAAEALARVYESHDAGLGRPGFDPDVAHAAAPAHAPAAVIERDWLDGRLAQVASRIESSLAGNRADTSLAALGQRFDQLEQRFTTALENVATRSDVDGLRLVEAHISELAQQFERAEGQFVRLDGIERQLVGLIERLSDQHLADIVGRSTQWPDLEHMITAATERVMTTTQRSLGEPMAFAATAPAPQVDVELIAKAAADEAVQRYAGHAQTMYPGEDRDRSLHELRGLVENLAAERRQGDETTASMLDTMQQAMIRLLDRIDAIEMGQSHPGAPQYAAPAFGQAVPAVAHDASHAPRFVAEPDLGGLTHAGLHPPHFEAPPEARIQVRAEPHAEPETRFEPHLDPRAEPAFAGPAPQTAAFAAVVAAAAEPAADAGDIRIEPILGPVNEQMKQDFIAAARRARRNVAGQSALKLASPPPAERLPARPQKPTASAAPKVAEAAGKGKPAAAANAPASGLSFLKIPRKLFLGGSTAVLAIVIAALLMPRAQSLVTSTSAPHAETVTVAAAGENAAQTTIVSGRTAAPETVVDDLGAAEHVDGGGLADRVVSDQTGMPKGIMLQSPDQPPTPDDLARASRQQQMANLSTELGAAAAASPAALVTEQSIGRPAAANGAVSSAPAQGSALDLPPASVGPLSLRLAAAKGDPSAEFEVGARLAEGKGTNQNFVDAAKWYGRAAQRGFAQAQYRLGTLLERGLGQKADLQRARVWYKRAAEQGNVKAMHNLAVLSAGRQASAPDYATAAQWFGEAAGRGLADSQFNLAVLFESGLGVPKDMKQAYKWFSIAARSGDKESVKRRDQARAQLSPQELEGAEASIREWTATPQDFMANDARAAGEAWKTRASEDNG